MNPPSTGLWNDPPPPGIEDEKDHCMEKVDKNEIKTVERDPYVKSSQHIDYDNHKHRDRHSHRKRSRSRSYDRYKSRSRSRDRDKKHRSRTKRHRKSPSQSRGHYRNRSISHSRSPSYDRSSRKRHKDRRRRRSPPQSRGHSRSRTRSHSRNHKRHYSKLSRKSRTYSHSPTSDKNELSDTEINKDDEKFEEDENESINQNNFKNDGSFLELYKKMQEEQNKTEAAKAEASASEIKIPTYGKRRGGRVLKTGVVVKSKVGDDSEGGEPQDPWSIYLKEVKRYKEACCDDDSKTRPLVK